MKTLCIEWPSGVVQELQNIPAKQMITVIEPHLQGAFDDTGAFRIAVTCDNHRSYGIEVSTDLVEWTNVADFTAGSGVYTEDAPHTQRRFYRLRQPATTRQAVWRLDVGRGIPLRRQAGLPMLQSSRTR